MHKNWTIPNSEQLCSVRSWYYNKTLPSAICRHIIMQLQLLSWSVVIGLNISLSSNHITSGMMTVYSCVPGLNKTPQLFPANYNTIHPIGCKHQAISVQIQIAQFWKVLKSFEKFDPYIIVSQGCGSWQYITNI